MRPSRPSLMLTRRQRRLSDQYLAPAPPELTEEQKKQQRRRQRRGEIRAERHAAKIGKFPGFIIELIARGQREPRLPRLSPGETVVWLGRYHDDLRKGLRRWRVPHAESPSPLTLGPFALAGFYLTQFLGTFARPPHRLTVKALVQSEEGQRVIADRWGDPHFARTLFEEQRDHDAWLDNCQHAARALEEFRHLPAETLALARRCRNRGCRALFLYLGGYPSRICPRCRRAVSRSTPKRPAVID
jgi:hypothetical protein